MIDGFRETYKQSIATEEVARDIIKLQSQQLKDVATYYLTRFYELRLAQTDEAKHPELLKERDELITKFFQAVDETTKSHLDILNSRFRYINRLLEALYNFHSAEPLSVEQINSIIENSKNLLKKLNNE